MTDIDAFDVDELPELDTEVGMAGRMMQAEVGGQSCFGVVVALAILNQP